jgi:hypothetical protein
VVEEREREREREESPLHQPVSSKTCGEEHLTDYVFCKNFFFRWKISFSTT